MMPACIPLLANPLVALAGPNNGGRRQHVLGLYPAYSTKARATELRHSSHHRQRALGCKGPSDVCMVPGILGRAEIYHEYSTRKQVHSWQSSVRPGTWLLRLAC